MLSSSRVDDTDLNISGNWPSARGTPLGDDITRDFTAGPADHQQPDLAKWKVTVPAAHSSAPLVCGLGSPLDWALLHSDVRVETTAGRPVVGTIQTSKQRVDLDVYPPVGLAARPLPNSPSAAYLKTWPATAWNAPSKLMSPTRNRPNPHRPGHAIANSPSSRNTIRPVVEGRQPLLDGLATDAIRQFQ
ncbi:MAG: hypothetical protein Ct9H300mP1_10860 [Planctomycetaceae bacterium]|nr:MAG: hypothetical protein Ct9H300mP1_10860 [Planctomycetaceae bacterium]